MGWTDQSFILFICIVLKIKFCHARTYFVWLKRKRSKIRRLLEVKQELVKLSQSLKMALDYTDFPLTFFHIKSCHLCRRKTNFVFQLRFVWRSKNVMEDTHDIVVYCPWKIKAIWAIDQYLIFFYYQIVNFSYVLHSGMCNVKFVPKSSVGSFDHLIRS